MIHSLIIEKVVFGGEGLGFIAGKACFVPDVLPGEKVEVEVGQDKKNFLRARLVRILEPSPHRVKPACFYTAHCGGCQYQHVSYKEELRIKENQVREALIKELELSDGSIGSIVPSDNQIRYRSSLTLHIPSSKKGGAGFIGKDNKSIIPVTDCLLADEKMRPLFGAKLRLRGGEDRISYKLSDTGECISDQEERFFRIRLGEESLVASSKGFIQNNLSITEKIVTHLKSWVEESLPDTFFDLYAGIGTFGLLAAINAPKVICFEENPHALAALAMNREEREAARIEIIKGRVERTFPEYFSAHGKGKNVTVWMDPPRQGIEKRVCEFLSRQEGINRIGYLSCDLATLVRDLKIILSGGRYTIEKVQHYDMFPRTKHVEVAVFMRICDGKRI